MPRRARTRQSVSVKAAAHALPADAYRTIAWREESNEMLHGHFAAVRVRHVGGNSGRARLRDPMWLLIEWLESDADPLKYYFKNPPADTALEELVRCAHMRWRIESDYQGLKQELGLGHYKGRGWRGFHHHAALSIAAHGFLVGERLRTGKKTGSKKAPSFTKYLRFPRITSRAAVLRARRHVPDSIATIRHQLGFRLIESLDQSPC